MTTTEAVTVPKFGVVLFDDPSLATVNRDGWASAAGETARRHSGVTDLESSTIWITNAEFNAAREAGFGSVHNLRGSSFLASTMKAIADDLRLGVYDANADSAARALSAIVDRTCRHAASIYRAKDLFGGYTLCQGIQGRTFPEPQTPPSDLAYALLSAYQRSSACEGARKWVDSPNYFRLRLPRIRHAMDVLNGAIPEGPVEYIPGNRLPVTDAQYWVDKPVLAKVSVSRVDPKIAPILAFGSTYSKTRTLREWVAAPELMLLAEYTKVTVKGVYLWDRWGALPHDQRLPAALTSDPMLDLSYSAGLLAEIHLAAALAAAKPQQYSPRSVFLAARDRVLSFLVARDLADEGFLVTNYGGGGVQVKVRKGDIPALNDFIRNAGMPFPVSIERATD